MQTTTTEFIPFHRYNAPDRDWAWGVNGETVSWAPTKEEAEAKAAAHAADQQAFAERCDANAALVELERQAGVVETMAEPLIVAPAPARIRQFLPATAAEIATAVYTARQELTEPAAIRAVNRAYEELLHGMWIYDGERLIVPSRTTKGERYTATADECECAAFGHGRVCWHRAAFIVVATASAHAERAARLADHAALYAALQTPGAADPADLTVPEAREVLDARQLVAHA